ncbi:MAG: hypothetical protein JRG84_17255 [Deltaproteobacteria bacterium]|nr:hypothetical protein [Deltaproteobacteria bacterium]
MIVHDLDVEELRALAPRIPFELLADYYLAGNAEEVFERLAPFAAAGLEHVILTLCLGMVGGPPEIEEFLAEFARLREMLATA